MKQPTKYSVAIPLSFNRADPAELARFDPSNKRCTMNCGPHKDDPRTEIERRFLCQDCVVFAQPVSAGLTDEQKYRLLDWASACQLAYHIENTPGHRFGGIHGQLAENRAALVEYVDGLLFAAQRDNG